MNLLKNTLKYSVKFTINLCLHVFLLMYKAIAGDYCVGVIPDPIPNSEVKPCSANGTLS